MNKKLFSKPISMNNIIYNISNTLILFWFGRVFWIVTVLASMVTCLLIVALRTHVYLQHDTNIDIELKFVNQVPFPAVTICNQNAYRMTKAVDLHLYNFIDAIYSAKKKSSKWFYDVTT